MEGARDPLPRPGGAARPRTSTPSRASKTGGAPWTTRFCRSTTTRHAQLATPKKGARAAWRSSTATSGETICLVTNRARAIRSCSCTRVSVKILVVSQPTFSPRERWRTAAPSRRSSRSFKPVSAKPPVPRARDYQKGARRARAVSHHRGQRPSRRTRRVVVLGVLRRRAKLAAVPLVVPVHRSVRVLRGRAKSAVRRLGKRRARRRKSREQTEDLVGEPTAVRSPRRSRTEPIRPRDETDGFYRRRRLRSRGTRRRTTTTPLPRAIPAREPPLQRLDTGKEPARRGRDASARTEMSRGRRGARRRVSFARTRSEGALLLTDCTTRDASSTKRVRFQSTTRVNVATQTRRTRRRI